MIVGLNIDHNCTDRTIPFVVKSLGKREQVKCQATLERLTSSRYEFSKLVIPGALPSQYDYDFENLIKFIRIDKDEALAKIPIMVVFDDEDKYLDFLDLSGNDQHKGFQELKYNKIAVTVVPCSEREEFIHDFDEKVLNDYLTIIGRNPYRFGSHDNANRWGAYVVAASLSLADKENKDLRKIVKKIREQLIEEVYYKRLIQNFQQNGRSLYFKKIEQGRSEFQKIFPRGKVLIVEDQLDDGWEDAYRALFSSADNVQIFFAKDVKSARTVVSEHPDLDLILLDVRLDKEKDEGLDETDRLSGVKLARRIRSKLPTVPIICATASNKSWTLESLLDKGINGYWVKGSPDYVSTADLGVENVFDLYQKINSALNWSQRTRGWQQELYRIAGEVKRTSDPKLSDRLFNKAKSLQALLFRSFSPFSDELSSGLQMNLAFLEIYSCLNDIAIWVCNKYGSDEKIEYRLDSVGGEVVVIGEKNGMKFDWFFPYNKNETKFKFPDRLVTERLISLMKDSFEDKSHNYWTLFEKLAVKRNGLPLIHGKTDPLASASNSVECIEDKDIDNLISLMSEIVNFHVKYLNEKEMVTSR